MGKVSEQAKNTYAERVRGYKQKIDQIVSHETMLVTAIEKDKDVAAATFKRLIIAEDRLYVASLYLLMNRVSLALLSVKNEAFLNEARKCCYDAIIMLEKAVSDELDVPFSAYSDRLEQIEAYSEEQRYNLVRKLGFTIDSVKEDFGENTKWKWSFVELEGRYATVTKNLINFRTLVGGLDPRVAGYESRVRLLKLSKDLLSASADRFREKYELSTNRIDDFKVAINFIAALKRVHLMLGETDLAESAKKKFEVWKSKMEDDEKRHEKEGA